VDPVPDPLFLRKSGSSENRTRTSGSVARPQRQSDDNNYSNNRCQDERLNEMRLHSSSHTCLSLFSYVHSSFCLHSILV
jgi:hypothetical protein